MQMIQDGQYANAPDKPLRMTGTAESCRVSTCIISTGLVINQHIMCKILMTTFSLVPRPRPVFQCLHAVLDVV